MKKYLFFTSLLFSSNFIFASEINETINLYKQEKFFEAKNSLDQIKTRDNPKFWYYRAIIFHKLFKNEILSDDAESFFNETINSYSEVEKYKNKQINSFAKNNLNELIIFLIKRGNMFIKMENYKDALISFQRANKIDKENFQILKNIATLYQKLGNHKKSLELFENQKEADLLFSCNQVKFLLKQKNNNKALELIKKLLSEHPYNVACLEVFYFYLKNLNKNSQKKICDKILSQTDNIKNYQKAVLAKLQNDFKNSYDIFFQLYENDNDLKILIQLCDVGYIYSQKLIKISNDDLDNEDKYNKAREVLEKTIFFTEKLSKYYPNNVNVLEHLLKLYEQGEHKEKEYNVKNCLKKIGCDYIFEE